MSDFQKDIQEGEQMLDGGNQQQGGGQQMGGQQSSGSGMGQGIEDNAIDQQVRYPSASMTWVFSTRALATLSCSPLNV